MKTGTENPRTAPTEATRDKTLLGQSAEKSPIGTPKNTARPMAMTDRSKGRFDALHHKVGDAQPGKQRRRRNLR